ncbi:hypothetical protein EV699_113122 [Plasticicumulans lactativorans]|uniref:IraD/Gp25-like domain-containing protein n=1 Tax=Plasticicumulans lactativorans TaxID=1133106 RepID=A0A4R2L2E6_9GAMM|nr:GPW/gp25 family protein [Plasticicumulans lactativorans]TCO80644.1 hypothetical protein EV699_113122 [Plasticicumulans lactativorans]
MNRLDRLGRGFAFPWVPDREGRLVWRSGDDKLREAIRLILSTEPGERVMRPGFGCGLRRYLMQPNTTATRALIAREAQLALGRFEPRIAVQAVNVDPGEDPALVLIRVAYVQLADGRRDNLVYPFYLE